MVIKLSQRFRKNWLHLVDYTLEKFGLRQVKKNIDRLEFLMHVLSGNPKYGFPEPLLRESKKHEYRSILFVGSYKIVYYASKSSIHLVDIWNMKMNPTTLVKPYKGK